MFMGHFKCRDGLDDRHSASAGRSLNISGYTRTFTVGTNF